MDFAIFNETRGNQRHAIRVSRSGECTYFVSEGGHIIRDETFLVDRTMANSAVSELYRIWEKLPPGSDFTVGLGNGTEAPFTKSVSEVSVGYFVGLMRTFTTLPQTEVQLPQEEDEEKDIDLGAVALYAVAILAGACLIGLMIALSTIMLGRFHWAAPIISLLAGEALLWVFYGIAGYRVGMATNGPIMATAVGAAATSLVMLALGLAATGTDPTSLIRPALFMIGLTSVGASMATKKRKIANGLR